MLNMSLFKLRTFPLSVIDVFFAVIAAIVYLNGNGVSGIYMYLAIAIIWALVSIFVEKLYLKNPDVSILYYAFRIIWVLLLIFAFLSLLAFLLGGNLF